MVYMSFGGNMGKFNTVFCIFFMGKVLRFWGMELLKKEESTR